MVPHLANGRRINQLPGIHPEAELSAMVTEMQNLQVRVNAYNLFVWVTSSNDPIC